MADLIEHLESDARHGPELAAVAAYRDAYGV
jgi:hypothetical protein